MDYVEYTPSSQNDQLRFAGGHFTSFSRLKPVNFFNAGMGSGKSEIIAQLPHFLGFGGVTVLITPSRNLENQLTIVLKKHMKALRYDIIVGDDRNAKALIESALHNGRRPFVLFRNIGPRKSTLNGNGRQMKQLLESLAPLPILVLIDEIDSILTSLTGGINAKLDHSPTIMKAYKAVIGAVESPNAFDIFRGCKARVVCFSGTSNNLICSKLPALGYAKEDIGVANIAPIAALYNSLRIEHVDTCKFDNLKPFIEDFERPATAAAKGLLIFGTRTQMTDFKRWYATAYGHRLSHVVIDCSNGEARETDAWKAEFATARYVCGINMVGVGFDLSTFCEGLQFGLGVLFRKMDDKISHPLSKNPEHDLHMEISASVLQALARLRKGGVFVLPTAVGITSLYEGLMGVFERIRDGHNEYSRVGKARKTQRGRHHQCLLLALIQNMKRDNRPVVEEVLTDLLEVTGGVKFDHRTFVDPNYWIDALGVVWLGYLAGGLCLVKTQKEAFRAKYPDGPRGGTCKTRPVTPVEPAPAAPVLVPEHPTIVIVSLPAPPLAPVAHVAPPERKTPPAPPPYNPVKTSGSGVQTGRVVDLDVKAAVIERACGVCCHCGGQFADGPHNDDTQICHVQRQDCCGPYTSYNLMYGHKSCDAAYDAGLLIHDPAGGYWLHRRCTSYKPDTKQIAGIGCIHVAARFAWEKEKQMCAVTDSDTFRAHLVSSGYTYCAA